MHNYFFRDYLFCVSLVASFMRSVGLRVCGSIVSEIDALSFNLLSLLLQDDHVYEDSIFFNDANSLLQP